MSANRACIFGCEATDLGADEAAFFRAADPWGFILFARNIESPAQVARLTDALRASVGRDAPVFVDQEGGRVQRLRAPHWREWMPPFDMVQAAGAAGGRAMWLRSRLIAAELRAVGIDGNCAPNADLAMSKTHQFLKNRCYGNDLRTVIDVSRQVASGLLAGGVLPVMKHIPGHGRATLDTHLELPRVAEASETLFASDFAVFRALNDLPLGMTAHIVFTEYDNAPATCSPRMVQLIRDEIGFLGLLMTDDIAMEALSGSLAERAAASRLAGCDVVLHCNGTLSEREAVADAAGRLDAAGQARADAALGRRHAPLAADVAALEGELTAIFKLSGFKVYADA